MEKNKEFRAEPPVLYVKIPLRSRIFSILFFLSLSIFFLYLNYLVPKYGLLLGRDILRVDFDLLKIRIPKEYISYLMFALSAISFGYFLDIFLTIKSKLYKFSYINIIYTHGYLTTYNDSVDLTTIRDHFEKTSLMQKLLGISTIEIISQDKTHPTLSIVGLEKEDSEKVISFINNYANRNYTEYRIKKDLKKEDPRHDPNYEEL